MPKVSIVMPAYNASRYIAASIDSALAQTMDDFELLVIDDGSTDGTAAIVAGYAARDARIRSLANPQNSGVSATRRRGVEQAHGSWIAFLDSDDLWQPDKLARQMALLADNPTAVICYTGSGFIDAAGRAYGYVMHVPARIDYPGLLRHNIMSCSSVVVRRDVMLAVRPSPDSTHEDYTAWLQVLRDHPYAYGLDEPLLTYRLSASSKSASRLKAARMEYNTYRFMGYGPLKTLWLVARMIPYSLAKRKAIKASPRP